MSESLGFRFRGRHAHEFGIGCKSVNRQVLPEKTKNEYEIPGRHGTIDFGGGVYRKRYITMELGLVDNADWNALRVQAHSIAEWLSGGGGILIFDDEPYIEYEGAVFQAVNLEQLELLPLGKTTVVFECQPFGRSTEYSQISHEINKTNKRIDVLVSGISACAIITIKNIGNEPIKGIKLKKTGGNNRV